MSLHRSPFFHVLVLVQRQSTYDTAKPTPLAHFSLNGKWDVSTVADRVLCGVHILLFFWLTLRLSREQKRFAVASRARQRELQPVVRRRHAHTIVNANTCSRASHSSSWIVTAPKVWISWEVTWPRNSRP